MDILFFRKFMYHLIMLGGYLFARRSFSIAMVAKLSKAPLVLTYMTRQNLSLRIELSIMFTRVDSAVSVPFVPLYACCIDDILP